MKTEPKRIYVVFAGIVALQGFSTGANAYRDIFRTEIYGKGIDLVSYPPHWQCSVAGAVTTLIAFLILFWALCSVMRVTTWIFEGLKRKRNRPEEYSSWPC